MNKKMPTIGYIDGEHKPAVWVEIGDLTIYFSYTTPVAFFQNGLKVSQNVWSKTTGKHLNLIDGGDKKSRLPVDEFNAQLHAALVKFGLEES